MPSARAAFLAEQIAALDPFGFVVLMVPDDVPAGVQVARAEDGGFRVEVAERPDGEAYSEAQLAALRTLGFGEDRVASVPDGPAAAALAERVLAEVFGAPSSAALDVAHGSTRLEHEAEERLAKLRARIEPILEDLLGAPPVQDADGDYVFRHESAQVYVAPRCAPGLPPIVRVFSITNLGVNVSPDLGMFLARLNFSLTFGRFALDVEHRAVWFDDTLLGEDVTPEALRFTIGIVADTADEWDDQIARLFGGVTSQGALDAAAASGATPTPLPEPPLKPGQGGYL